MRSVFTTSNYKTAIKNNIIVPYREPVIELHAEINFTKTALHR